MSNILGTPRKIKAIKYKSKQQEISSLKNEIKRKDADMAFCLMLILPVLIVLIQQAFPTTWIDRTVFGLVVLYIGLILGMFRQKEIVSRQ
jgi:uncharacterized membrane protein